MKYLNILFACANELWALDQTKLAEMVGFLLFKAEGGMLSPMEIEARVSQKRDREVASAPGNVAVLPLHGLMVPRVSRMNVSENGTALDALAGGFRKVLADDSVKAIIFDVDSPGGLVDGTEEFAQEVFEARGIKPIVAQVNSLAASAAYWVAAQADEIVVTPSGSAGSVGVSAIHDDLTAAMEKAGVKKTIIKAGKFKGEGNPFEPLSAEASEHMQKRVDTVNDIFVKALARGRGLSQSHINDKFGQGRAFQADELIKRGMADRIAPMRETLGRFGVELSPARRSQAATARAELALGRNPAIGDVEALLREAGASKNFASAFASGGMAKVNRSDPGSKGRSDPGSEGAKPALTRDSVVALTHALRGFKLPTFERG